MGPGNGCGEFSTDPELPVIPSVDSKCLGLQEKHGGKSRFELHPKFLKGKLVVAHPTNPAPGKEYMWGEPTEDTGFHDIVRQDRDGNPCTYRVKDGKVYSANEEQRYLGELCEMFPEPTEEEIEAGVKEALRRHRDELKKQLQQLEKEID
jgi:hypothetical protein